MAASLPSDCWLEVLWNLRQSRRVIASPVVCAPRVLLSVQIKSANPAYSNSCDCALKVSLTHPMNGLMNVRPIPGPRLCLGRMHAACMPVGRNPAKPAAPGKGSPIGLHQRRSNPINTAANNAEKPCTYITNGAIIIYGAVLFSDKRDITTFRRLCLFLCHCPDPVFDVLQQIFILQTADRILLRRAHRQKSFYLFALHKQFVQAHFSENAHYSVAPDIVEPACWFLREILFYVTHGRYACLK